LPLLARRGVCAEGADGVVDQIRQTQSFEPEPPPRPLALLASTPPGQEGQSAHFRVTLYLLTHEIDSVVRAATTFITGNLWIRAKRTGADRVCS